MVAAPFFCLSEVIWSGCPPQSRRRLLCPNSTSIRPALTLTHSCFLASPPQDCDVGRESCFLRLVSFLLHLLAVVLSSRMDQLPLLADSRLDSLRLSLAETSGVTLRHVENIYKFESQNEASTQNTSMETSFSLKLNFICYIIFVLEQGFKQ